MRRSAVLVIALVLLTFTVSGCGRDVDRPTVSNRHPFVGEKFTVSGDIGTDGARPVVLESFDEGWNPVADARTSADGAYTFTTSTKSSSTQYRVVAEATKKLEKHVSDPVKVTTVDDSVSLSVVRTGHDDGLAIGEAKVVQEGRNFELQYLHGKAWRRLGSGTEDKHGRTRIDFELSKGEHYYRLVGDVIKGTEGASSPPMPFTMGPANLGKNVTYVTVDQNKEPTIKGFEVRGNSTADKIKKPYKLKFKKSRRPFGLPEDKTWILLANFNDHSLIRTQLGYAIGAGLDGLRWTPRGKFTELYVNGVYQGSYQISESIKIDKNRIDIDKKTGVVIEIDPHFKEDHVPGFVGGHKIPYAFKDPDERKNGKDEEKGVTDAKVDAMTKRILDFEKVLYGSNFKDPKEGWTKYLDLDAAVDYYLVKEYTKENDGDFYRSNFFYTADYSSPSAKFVMGPVWDFDRSAGAKPDVSDSGTTIASPYGWWLRGHGSPNHKTDRTHWFVPLTKDPVFLEALNKRWAEKRAFFKDIADHGVDRMAQGVQTAADNDRRLLANADDSIIEGKRLNARATTYAGEIAFLKRWYQQRFAWMDAKLR